MPEIGAKLAHTMISKSTLMEPKRPIRNFCRSPNHLCVLPCKLRRVRGAPSQEVKVQYTSYHIILQRRRRILCLGQLYIHPI